MTTTLQEPEIIPGNGFVSGEARRLIEEARTKRERRKQVLNLQRQRILSLEKSQPARHAVLEAALAQIDGQIKAIN
jgi:hypothetical protein